MKKFSEEDIERYLKYTDENVLNREELLGHCFICGELLDEIDLPNGPEKKIVCLKDRDYFVESYEELKELGEL